MKTTVIFIELKTLKDKNFNIRFADSVIYYLIKSDFVILKILMKEIAFAEQNIASRFRILYFNEIVFFINLVKRVAEFTDRIKNKLAF